MRAINASIGFDRALWRQDIRGSLAHAAMLAHVGIISAEDETAIRRGLKLNKPIYRRTAAYGHFGRAPDADGGFSWEKTDIADAIKKAVS